MKQSAQEYVTTAESELIFISPEDRANAVIGWIVAHQWAQILFPIILQQIHAALAYERERCRQAVESVRYDLDWQHTCYGEEGNDCECHFRAALDEIMEKISSSWRQTIQTQDTHDV